MKPKFQTYLSVRTRNENYKVNDLPRGLDYPKSFVQAYTYRPPQIYSQRMNAGIQAGTLGASKSVIVKT